MLLVKEIKYHYHKAYESDDVAHVNFQLMYEYCQQRMCDYILYAACLLYHVPAITHYFGIFSMYNALSL